MKKEMRNKALALSIGMAIAGSALGNEVQIPIVPASVMTQDVPRPIDSKPKQSADRGKSFVGLAKVNEDSVVVMEQGVNQIVPVAIEHPNRIVTPFNRPETQSVIDENVTTIETKGNVVYVSTASERPVTLFITEKGDQSRALSLTLVPQRIPPRELFLQLPDGVGFAMARSNEEADRWETSQPYVQTIRTVFRQIALGEVPQGYSMTRIPSNMRLPNCNMSGLNFDFRNGQVLMGHNLSVLVGVATNTSSQPIEFREAVCGAWDVAAVASWPLNVLEPGEKTEIYVARKIGRKKQGPVSKRPSLVGAY